MRGGLIGCAGGVTGVPKCGEMGAGSWGGPAEIGGLWRGEARGNGPSVAAIAGLMTEIGSGLLNGVTPLMREPVTTIESSGAGVGVVAVSPSWAAEIGRAHV